MSIRGLTALAMGLNAMGSGAVRSASYDGYFSSCANMRARFTQREMDKRIAGGETTHNRHGKQLKKGK